MAKVSARVPMPSVLQRRSGVAASANEGGDLSAYVGSDKQFCTNGNHKCVADCVAEAVAVTAPTNGEQKCLLVGMWNAHLMFRILMQHDSPPADDLFPAGAQTAGALWQRFESAVNGCTDYLCDHGGRAMMLRIIQVYADFGNPIERGNALAILLALQLPPDQDVRYRNELLRVLRIHLQATPTLDLIYKRLIAV